MTWKLLWQMVFIMGMVSFVMMSIIFTIKGYHDIKKIIKKNDDKQ